MWRPAGRPPWPKWSPFWAAANAAIKEITGCTVTNNCAVMYLHGPHTACHVSRACDVTARYTTPFEPRSTDWSDNNTQPPGLVKCNGSWSGGEFMIDNKPEHTLFCPQLLAHFSYHTSRSFYSSETPAAPSTTHSFTALATQGSEMHIAL